MPSSIHRTLVAVSVAGSIALTCALSACEARRHGPAGKVIVVPSPGRVSDTIDGSRMDWLSRFMGAESRTAGR